MNFGKSFTGTPLGYLGNLIPVHLVVLIHAEVPDYDCFRDIEYPLWSRPGTFDMDHPLD